MQSGRLTIVALLLTTLAVGGRGRTAETAELACTPSGQAPESLGVVLLHGKETFSLGPVGGGSRAGSKVSSVSPADYIAPLVSALKKAGFRVSAPAMPWTLTHPYDQSWEQAMDLVGHAAAALRADGAARIVVGGHSLGANAALGYAAADGGVAGVIALSPGHYPDRPGARVVDASIERARSMVSAGKGNESATFEDLNVGKTGNIRTTAANYLSFWDPGGHAVIARNVAALPPGTPLLWVFGEDDPLTARIGPRYAFNKAPPNPLNHYLVVPGGHLETPATAAPAVITWLKCL